MKLVIIFLVLISIYSGIKIYLLQKKIIGLKWENDKSKYHMQIFSDWLFFIGQYKSLEEKLVKQKIETISIYGLSLEGYRLFEQLLGSTKLDLRYVVDQNYEMHSLSIPVIGMHEINEYGLTDAIIIAIDCRKLNLQKELINIGFKKVFTIGEVING